MEQQPLFFSSLFFIAFAVYLFFGIYLMRQNPKAKLNRAFFAVCVSLCLWSLGFAVANAAPTLQTCLFWRRISALGWTTAYALLLHFFLLLTGSNWGDRRWVCHAALHAPAAISLYVFSLSNRFAAQQYNFVRRPSGWVNVAPKNAWDFFFFLYFAGYMLASLWLLRRWRQRAGDRKVARHATLMLFSLLIAGILGALTGLIPRFFLANPLPQVGPLVTLIPMGTAWFLIKRYRLLGEETASEVDGILDEASEGRLYHYLALTFFAGGLLGLLSNFLPVSAGQEAIVKASTGAGAAAVILGLIILLLGPLKPVRLKGLLMLAVTLFSIPLVTFKFADFGVTVWVFPILFMMVSLVFDTRLPLIAVMLAAVVSQFFLWRRMPSQIHELSHFDYVFRIGFLVIVFWLGMFVNGIYRRRLKENIYQRDFQKMISELSLDFMTINRENMEQKIEGLLQAVGEFFAMSSAYLFLLEPGAETISATYVWHPRGIDYLAKTFTGTALDELPWLAAQLRSNELVYVADLAELPNDARSELEPLTCPAAEESAVLPIHGGGRLLGFIGFNCMDIMGGWSEDQFGLLRVLGNLIADAVVKMEAEKEIEFLAYYDELTGLPNRTLFTDRLTAALHLAKRNARLIAVVFIDLDGFKMVNDVLGHAGGDLLLQGVALNLERNLRKTDTVARFGADEFLVLVNNIESPADIEHVAEKIIRLFEQPFNINDQEFFVTASAGIAISPVDGEDGDSLIKNADIALHEAKLRGKNRYVFCTPDLKKEVQMNMKLSNSLFRALERGELELYYQPQINLPTSKITGVEALLRWKHPQLGMISPAVFIPLAERSGLITKIGEWVLQTATLQNQRWQKMGLPSLRISVNLSVIQFNDPRIVDKIGEVLAKNGLAPQHLEVEITENMVIRDLDYTIEVLQRLKKLGVSIAIDDFGTEYSALGRLKLLPLDRIKIDMQFIQGIDHSQKDRAITEVMINLGKSLGLEVLAEGVETPTQLDFLRKKRCDDVQGFYYYKPMPAAEIETLLQVNGNLASPRAKGAVSKG